MVLATRELASRLRLLSRILIWNSHSVEVTSIEVNALWIVHPRIPALFGRLRAVLDPVIQICSDGTHLSIQLGALLGCTVDDVLVNTENCLVGTRLYSLQLDYVYERLYIGPLAGTSFRS
jgi:hypothetical protein